MLRFFLNGLSSIQQNKLFLNIFSFLVQPVKTQRWMMDLFKLFHIFFIFNTQYSSMKVVGISLR